MNLMVVKRDIMVVALNHKCIYVHVYIYAAMRKRKCVGKFIFNGM